MDEYIRGEKLIDKASRMCIECEENNSERCNECLAACVLDEERVADVAPVRHGYWKDHGYKWQCSECGVLMDLDGTPRENLLFYCPNCGARMDGGAEDAF